MRLFTKKTVRRLWLTAVAAVVSLTANAQFSQTVQQYPTSDYSSVSAEFKLSDVAQALETDAATLAAAYEVWAEDPTVAEGTPMFQVKGSAGVLAPADATGWTGNAGEMWMDAEGNAASYGETAKFYGGINCDVENDLFVVYVGQMPNANTGGDVLKTTAVLNFNGKQATFDITFNILVMPEVPEPSTVLRSELSKLTLVGEQTINAERYDHQGYDALSLSADLTGVAELLGTEAAVLAPSLSQLIFTNWYDTELGVMKDSLTNQSTAGAPGWWLRRTMYPQGHPQQGELSDDLGAAGYGADCSIFLEGFKLDPATNALTCNLGQYPSTCKAGENVNAEIYIIYGDKYYKLNYKVSFIEAPAQGLGDMTNVGNLDYEINIDDQSVDYQAYQVNIDVDAIAAALGLETTGLEAKMLKDETTLYSGTGTANNGGYWVDANGFVCNWGETAMSYWEPVTSNDYSVLNVGLYGGKQTNVGATYTDVLYFLNGDKYFTVTLNINIVKKEGGLAQTEWEIVAKKPAAVQVIASASDYIVDGNQTQFTFTVAQAAELIGTEEPMLYIQNADSIPAQGGDIYAPYTKYLCSPAPGVWINKDGRGQGWSGNDQVPVGICWDKSTGKFSVYQVPGVNAIGSVFQASIFLVNEETGKMIEIPFTVSFVASLESVEVVGETNIKMPLASFDDTKVVIDLEAAAKALGVTVDDLTNADNYYFKGQLANGLYSEGTTTDNGLFFNANGECDPYGDITLNIVNVDGVYYLAASAMIDVEEGFLKTGAICFEVDGKIYVYNLTFMDNDSYITGISDVKTANNANGRIYNLNGVELKQAKGLFIQNGKIYNIK